jgi:single-strand DNA-binding protein
MISSTAINCVTLMGRLTADPELRQTAGGVSTVQFTLAVNRAYKNQNGEQESDFIRCVAWRQTAEFISRYFTKGRLIIVEGSLRTGSYDDRTHPDVKHYTTDVYVDSAAFGETKAASGGTYQAQAAAQAPAPAYQQAAPAAQRAPAAPANTFTPEDFEEVISDGEQLPF